MFQKIGIIFLLFSISISQVFGENISFQIISTLPNTSSDATDEYIEIENTSGEQMSLSGYILQDASGKKYIFPDIILEKDETRKFYRPETKILLNNTDEILYLYNPIGELLSEVSWEKSEKNIEIFFEKIILEQEKQEEIIEEEIVSDEININMENLVSDEVNISGETQNNEETENTENSSQNTENQSENQQTETLENDQENISSQELESSEKLEILFALQQPSYVNFNEETQIFICDTTKSECKINFDFRPSFTGSFLEKDYTCKIDFGLGKITGEEEKCNPNTVIFPEGNFEISVKISEKNNSENLTQKSFLMYNTQENAEEISENLGEEENTYQEESIENQNEGDISEENEIENSQETSQKPEISGEENSENYFENFKILFDLQRPSYVNFDEESQTFLCDETKDECKINFDFRPSFTGGFLEKNYSCQIDFGLGEITGEEEKCNPNTVIFPVGETKMSVKIISKEDSNHIFQQDSFVYFHKSSGIISGGEKGIFIYRPEIIIQSGLLGTGRYFSCEKEICKINLNYEKRNILERCEWDFGTNIINGNRESTRCNPGYITLGPGKSEITLKVYEKGNKQNYVKAVLYVSEFSQIENEEKENENQKVQILSFGEEKLSDDLSPENSQKFDINAGNIQLQGKISENKILSGSILECKNTKKCSINLNYEYPETLKNLRYEWKLNGEIFSQKQNPAGIWIYQENGEKQKIELSVSDTENQILGIKEILLSFILSEDNQKNLSDQKISTKKQKLPFTQSFLALKYDGLRISGKAPMGSEIQIFFQETLIFSQKIGEDGKYRFVSKNFKAGDWIFSTKIIYQDGREEFFENAKEYTLENSKRLYWFVAKKTNTSSKNSSSKISNAKFIFDGEEIGNSEISENISFAQIGGFFGMLFFILSGMFLHIFTLFGKKNDILNVKVYREIFSIRQKILLAL